MGCAPGFTGSVKVVAQTVENKLGSMITSRSPSVPHISLEWTDAVHALRCFWSSFRQSAAGILICLMSGLSGKTFTVHVQIS